MAEGLNLTLPPREPKRSRWPAAIVPVLLGLLLVVGVANLAVSLRGGRAVETPPAGGLGPGALKELALQLEKSDLGPKAVEAWKEYLQSHELSDEERAKVWYRIGKLHQEAGAYAEAVEAFLRSEAHAKLGDLAAEIGRRTQECLEAAGRFAGLRYHLADRIGMGSKEEGGSEVVAEIGREKITKAQLDRMIEGAIEQQLSQFAAFMPEEERKKQQEALLKRYSSAEQRARFLEQFIAEELLYRQAREAKLAEDPTTRRLLADVERKLLAQKALEREMAEQIKLTPGDLQTYYEAHKASYVQPERAQISHILLKDEGAAKEAIAKLRGGAKFAELAKELSLDTATKDKGGEIEGWVEKGAWIPGIGQSEEATAVIFSTEAGQVAGKPVRSDKGFHLLYVRKREPQRQKAFEEVRDEVYRALRSQKEREVEQALLERLRQRHDVVIHTSALAPQKPGAGTPAKGNEGNTPKKE